MTETPSEDIMRLEARVRHRLAGRGCHLRLVVRDNGVVLQGCVRTYYAKQLAQQAVMEANVLPLLANEIEVSESLSATNPRESQTLSRGYSDGEM